MDGKREILAPKEMIAFIKGIYPFAFRYARAASLQSGNNVHLCGPNGEKLDQIYVLTDKRTIEGTLVEVPRATQMRYMEGFDRADGKHVVVAPDEIKSILARPEKEVRHVKIEPVEAVPTEFIKSRYYVLAPKANGKKKTIGGQDSYNIVMGLLKEKGYQIAFNGVEGSQTRRFIIHFDGDVPVMDVLCLEDEVAARTPFVNEALSKDGAEMKPMVATLMEQLKEAQLTPVDVSKVDVLEEFFTAKMQGLPPKVEEQPKEVTDMKALLKMAIEKK